MKESLVDVLLNKAWEEVEPPLTREYKEADQKISLYNRELKKVLTKEQKDLLEKLEEAYVVIEGEYGDYFYKKGFADAMALFLESGRFNSDLRKVV